jgi:hypothetical protein
VERPSRGPGRAAGRISGRWGAVLTAVNCMFQRRQAWTRPTRLSHPGHTCGNFTVRSLCAGKEREAHFEKGTPLSAHFQSALRHLRS